MALQHALPLDVIDVRPLGTGLRDAVTTSLLKTEALQLMRLVLPAGRGLPTHSVPGAITVLCLEGEAVVVTPSRTTVDALAEINWENWRLSVNATNLLNNKFFASCLARGDCFVGAPRNVMATIGYRF